LGRYGAFALSACRAKASDIRSNGIFINGTNAPLPAHLKNLAYTPTIPDQRPSVAYPFLIPPGAYFVLGDNSTNANDSRFCGPLPASNIIGKVSGK
jgi:signal peptidase I